MLLKGICGLLLGVYGAVTVGSSSPGAKLLLHGSGHAVVVELLDDRGGNVAGGPGLGNEVLLLLVLLVLMVLMLLLEVIVGLLLLLLLLLVLLEVVQGP